MGRLRGQFDSLMTLRGSFAARLTSRVLLLCSLFLLMFFALAGGATAAPGATARDAAFMTVAPNPRVAIADFDGDRRPDLASVQQGASFHGSNTYWIQLQLSAVGRQSIQLVAPAGGLLIEARDVNGDQAVDLVLSTAWLRMPVAIFLNDGHGRFSRAEPSAFPGAFNQSNKNWGPTTTQETDAVGTPPQSRDGICLEAGGLPFRRSVVRSIPDLSSGFLFSRFLISHAGRAPPTQAFSL